MSSNKKPASLGKEDKPNTSSAGVIKQIVSMTEPAKPAIPAKDSVEKSTTEETKEIEEEDIVLTFEEREAAEQAERTREREAEVSSDMRAKLRNELASQGAYANKKSANPILIISGIVAVLVVLGGKDILF